MSRIVEKPWGSEEIVYENGDVVIKILRTTKGPLSLQLHPAKDEEFTLLDFDPNVISKPYLKFATPKTYNECVANRFGTYYLNIGSKFICPRMMVHYIPQGLTLLEYSKGSQVTLRIKDYYGRGEDLDEIRKLF